MNEKEHIILVDKPIGVTSFDVIRELRKKLEVQNPVKTDANHKNDTTSNKIKMGHVTKKLKLGHAGTLDPLASGLLIIGVGDGTKELAHLIKLPKVYEAEILFGKRTSTGDLEGEVLDERKNVSMTAVDLKSVLEDLIGTHEFVVPLYSAIKVNGKPLYWYARNGVEVEVPRKEMEVKSAKLVGSITKDKEGYVRAQVMFDVGSGTYIRTLAEVVGEKLGVPATLSSLRRISIGNFHIRDAKKLSEF